MLTNLISLAENVDLFTADRKMYTRVFGNIPASILTVITADNADHLTFDPLTSDVIVPDNVTYVGHVVSNTGVPTMVGLKDGTLILFTTAYKHSSNSRIRLYSNMEFVGAGKNNDPKGLSSSMRYTNSDAPENIPFDVFQTGIYKVKYGLEELTFLKVILNTPSNVYVSSLVTDISPTGNGMMIHTDTVRTPQSQLFIPMDLVRATGPRIGLSVI